MLKACDPKLAESIRSRGQRLLEDQGNAGLHLVRVANPSVRDLFDEGCDEIHYAGACRRVGRCMRLAVLKDGQWAGGIVLGSTFPNIGPRDKALGLKKFVLGWQARGLVSPWARENTQYWSALQSIVNHARTFVFPAYQGSGLGVDAHALLLTQGKRIWEEHYQCGVAAFDTLCTHPSSRLFAENGWELVGQTKGYSRAPAEVLSKRAFAQEWRTISDNAGLAKLEGSTKWWIWVRPICDEALEQAAMR